MLYLKKFPTHSEYESYIGGSDALRPNVSLCDDQPEHVHYNPSIKPAYMEFVDLGLPSGTLWAKGNLGSMLETDMGYALQWGSSVPAGEDDVWETCPFNNGSSTYDGAYFDAHMNEWIDSDGNLKLAYDPVNKVVGQGAHIPSRNQMSELWGLNYEFIEIGGNEYLKVTSLSDDSKYILLPQLDKGWGPSPYYWFRTLDDIDHQNAYNMFWEYGEWWYDTVGRYKSYLVRPVIGNGPS